MQHISGKFVHLRFANFNNDPLMLPQGIKHYLAFSCISPPYWPKPCPSGPWQLSDLARMRDTVVLPTPRVPVNR